MTVDVLVVPDSGYFFAQGVHIDYGAQSADGTEESAISNFKIGLMATLRLHQQRRADGIATSKLGATPEEYLEELRSEGAQLRQVEIDGLESLDV